MITIREIAELAGVSRGTVDRVLNGRGGVRDSVVEKINRIVAEHDYRPNKAARTLASHKKSYLLGVISPSIDNMFFKSVLKGIRDAERQVVDFGVKLVYREVYRFSVADQLALIDEMVAHDVDALAINPVNDPAVIARLREQSLSGLPIVTFNSDVEGVNRLAYIGCDYDRSGRIAAGLVGLVSGGDARVAVVIGSLTSLGHSLRLKGFQEAMTAYPKVNVKSVVEMYDDEITSYCRVRELIERDAGYDAFFFAAGGKEGGIRAILESPIRDTVKIVTVDLDPLTVRYLREGVVLATVCQQPYVQGYEAVWQLAHYVVYGERPERCVQFTRSEIITRECIDDDNSHDRFGM